MKQNRAAFGRVSEKTLVDAMLEAGFYPCHPEEILHKETHISHVFLAGELVYKVKKPVRFSFLDFSTPAKRRHFLEAELNLNRRLAPAIYLGIVPIFHDPEGWSLEGGGKPAEHALLMRRLPEKRMLDYLLDTRQATASMLESLARHLAKFHIGSEKVLIASGAHQERTRSDWNKNVCDLDSLMSDADDRAELHAIAAAGRLFLDSHADLMAQRAPGGWIRDVHGDLHAEHICFAPEGIQVFDCIEFSDELRRCDLSSEIAFFLMDLSVRGGGALRPAFLEPYREMLKDPAMPTLLPFYECYRALVRAKVHALRQGRWNQESARYFDFARAFTWQRFHPFVILVTGFTGSGKSTLSRALGSRTGAQVINSDEVRKRIAGKQGKEAAPLNEGIYSRAMTELTYDTMAREADMLLRQGRSVIVDATFAQRAQRASFLRLVERSGAPLIVIRCVSSDSTSAERLASRAAEGKDVSDGRWEVYVAQKAGFEPMDEIDPGLRLELWTEAPIEQLVAQSEAFLRERLKVKQKSDSSSLGSSHMTDR